MQILILLYYVEVGKPTMPQFVSKTFVSCSWNPESTEQGWLWRLFYMCNHYVTACDQLRPFKGNDELKGWSFNGVSNIHTSIRVLLRWLGVMTQSSTRCPMKCDTGWSEGGDRKPRTRLIYETLWSATVCIKIIHAKEIIGINQSKSVWCFIP